MTPEEMQSVIEHQHWATICTVSPDDKPYAVEATPFLLEPDCIGFMINPNGTTRKNLLQHPDILIKYTYSSADLADWAGVSCFGTGSFCEDKDTIAKGWQLLGKIMQTDYSKAAERFLDGLMPSPLLLAKISQTTGRCSAKPKEAMVFPW